VATVARQLVDYLQRSGGQARAAISKNIRTVQLSAMKLLRSRQPLTTARVSPPTGVPAWRPPRP